jgi:hypothetical protein
MKVEIENLPGVIEALSRIPGKLGDAFRNASAQGRRLLVGELTTEPPERPGQTYVRTGEQSRGWQRATPIAGGAGFQLINTSTHARWTQGTPQAWMHVGRWRTASQIAHELEEEILALFEQAAEEAIQ